jgi:Transposase DDE domain
VRRINRPRAAEPRLAFRSQNTRARHRLEALHPLWPKGWTVYVQCDSWYASAKWLTYVRRQRWHVPGGLKGNRTLNGVRIAPLASALRHRRYTRVRVTATAGNTTTYYVRQSTGRLSEVPYDGRVWFAKRHPRGQSSAYFLRTDLTRSAHQALQGYGGRWSCEVANFYLKTRLGLADLRVRSYEAVDRYMVVVHLAWGYIARRFIQERAAKVQCDGDIIRRHQEEHAREWLTGAWQMALETGAIEPVLQRFLRDTD